MISELDFPSATGRLRYGFSNPVEILVARSLNEVATVIARAEHLADRGLWVTGLVRYEAAPAFDAAFRVRQADGAMPLAVFAAYTAPDAIVATANPAGDAACGPWRMTTSRADFDAGIAAIGNSIADGDYYQLNFTTRLRARFAGDSRVFFQALCAAQPDAYCARLDGGDWQVLSVSPELFFEWTPDRQLITRPMKGTAARHTDADADAQAAQELSASAKERAENLMIVDLLRNDLSRIAETGSVQVPKLFEVEALPTAWQMTSTVSCKTRSDVGLVDVFRALFPCGSVTGAPKVAAMQAIAALENSPRGAYCGAIGLIRPGGHALFSVGIRTVSINGRGEAECGIGSGITADSTANGEYAEWLIKRRFLLRASASFELLETLRLRAGEYWLLARHMARLQDGAEHFGFTLNRQRVHAALEQLAAQHPTGAWRVRLLVDRHGAARTECNALEQGLSEVNVVLAATPIESSCEALYYKTTARDVYAPHASCAPGIFDTLLFNERDEITEFTKGNVVVELDGQRVTPPVSCGLLPGVLRAEMLAKGEVTERIITRADLGRVTGLWFVNSVRGMLPARLAIHSC